MAFVKFDVMYPYGEKHDGFGQFAKDLAATPDLLVGEVGVQDYGEKENEDLAKRFDIKKEDFPVALLFKGSTDSPVRFDTKDDKEWSADNLKAFVRKNTNIHILLDKCIESFDKLAQKLVATEDKAIQTKVLDEAKAEQAKLTKDDEKKSADIYVKVMHKIIERGNKFVESEQERVKNLLDGKLSDAKKAELKGRMNILQSFTVDAPAAKTEL